MPTTPEPGRSAELIAAACAAYGIPRPDQVEDLGGSFTTNLRLAGTPDLVLRIHPAGMDRDRLAAIQQARSTAREAGLPTAPALATPDGRTWIEHAGAAIELEPFLPWHDHMNTAERLITGFTLLGRLHDALSDVPLPTTMASRANHLAHDQSDRIHDGLARVRGWAEAWSSAYADAAEAHLAAVAVADPGPLPRRLCHGDFWDNNVGFAGGQVTALLDFDFLGERERIDDLALPFYFWLLRPGHQLPDRSDRLLLRALADAYDRGTSTPLTAEERQMLPVAVARQPAWSLGVWIPTLPNPDARSHARDAAAELPVAETIMNEITGWRDALTA